MLHFKAKKGRKLAEGTGGGRECPEKTSKLEPSLYVFLSLLPVADFASRIQIWETIPTLL